MIKIQDRTGEIIKSALSAAEKAKDANYIRVTWNENKATVITHVNGIDAAWIELDGEQLEEAIRLLQQARSEIVS